MALMTVRPERLRSNAARAIPILVLLYFAVYFLVPYKPWDWPISFHTPLLGAGLLAAAFLIFSEEREAFSRLKSPDILFFLIAGALFYVSSTGVHFSAFSRAGVQAYTISFLSFIFVRLAFPALCREAFFLWAMIHLVVSGVLMFLQVNFAGPFYVPGFFGQLNFGSSCQAWGFANTHILAGGMLAWLISVLLGRFALDPGCFSKRGSRALLFTALALGSGGILYTLSRGAWLGLAAGIFVLAIKVLAGSGSKKRFFGGIGIVLSAIVLFRFLPHPGVSNLDQKLLFSKNLAVNPESAIATDASSNTRVKAWGVAVGGIKGSPLWGIGILKFPDLYEKNFSDLFSADSSHFDPNPRQIPHNSYLYYAVEAGLLPAAALLLLVLAVGWRALRTSNYAEAFPFFAGLVAVCSWIMTCDYINERIFWMALGAAAAMGAPPVLGPVGRSPRECDTI